jgi:hypothetical protein
MTSSRALLLGVCVCGEPIVRHRIGRRQITCDAVRRIDEAFQLQHPSTENPFRTGDRPSRPVNLDRQGAVA